MKLKALDQMHISSVKSESLRPGEEFEVSDAVAAEILNAHPTKFLRTDGKKAERAPQNKAERVPTNKTITKLGRGK